MPPIESYLNSGASWVGEDRVVVGPVRANLDVAHSCGGPKLHPVGPVGPQNVIRRLRSPQIARESSAIRVLWSDNLLGHSTSAMVRRYSATYDAAKAADAHASFSPAARLLASGGVAD